MGAEKQASFVDFRSYRSLCMVLHYPGALKLIEAERRIYASVN